MNEFNFIIRHTKIWIVLLALALTSIAIAIPEKLMSIFGEEYTKGAVLYRNIVSGAIRSCRCGTGWRNPIND